jgi:aspartyl-tRNA(Asn)/glutamyl-tRNA(Gln) amidotransferase subunit B
MSYRPTIGLEVHAELATATKMFCTSENHPEGSATNSLICPVCMAYPGTLPTINRAAVARVLRVGAAIGATLADYTEFDRKSYFYPDMPKGYQITQFEYPLVGTGGSILGVPITRIHLEEDTARSSHEGKEGTSLVDFNRAGVPLMELVTEPEIHDAETAGAFARELQMLLRVVGASHANLEKGEMRVEVNVSVSKTNTFGTKVEVKNLNSFRSVERALAYEIERQSSLIDSGGTVIQETRGWDENKQVTFSQRPKEGSADYRYFPEPDLPKIKRTEVPEWTDSALAASLPELPWQQRARYIALGIKDEDANFIRSDRTRTAFVDAVIELLDANPTKVALAMNYFSSDLSGIVAKSSEEGYGKVTPESFSALVRMVSETQLSSRGAKDVLVVLYEKGGDPFTVATDMNLLQVSDPEILRPYVLQVIAENESIVQEYRAGKEANRNFLFGKIMKATGGSGNPEVLQTLLTEELLP